MSISIPTPENIKEKAKITRRFMKEKCNVDISHSHCIELISRLFGFNDWNTASAALKPNVAKSKLPIKVKTVGEMRRALEPFQNRDIIDGMYEFKLQEFVNEIEQDHLDLDGTITQEFSFILEEIVQADKHNVGIASFKLVLEDESIGFVGSPWTKEDEEQYQKWASEGYPPLQCERMTKGSHESEH